MSEEVWLVLDTEEYVASVMLGFMYLFGVADSLFVLDMGWKCLLGTKVSLGFDKGRAKRLTAGKGVIGS